MTIRERVRRALHKSDSSSNISQSESNITTTTTSSSSENSSLRKSPSTRLFQWRSHDVESSSKKKDLKEEVKKSKKKSKPTHPRDKPLTATNLRHQEMLSGFSMTFGSSPNRLSQLVDDFDDYGVSPCCTRSPSFDGTLADSVPSHDSSSTSLSDAMPPPKIAASADY
jgi:hypothetical protein